MKKKYPKMKIPGWFYLLAFMASASGNLASAQDMDGEKPIDPDLDAEGIRLVIRVEGAYEVPDGTFWAAVGDKVYLKHRLSRNPQPRNEWQFDKYGVEKYVDDVGWIAWDTLYVDTTKIQSYELIFRGRMEFSRPFIEGWYGEDEVYTLSSQLFVNILRIDPNVP